MINLTPEQISKIINIAIASLKIKSITIPHMKIRRVNIHLLMYGNVGSTKSTILYDVARITKGNVRKGLTKANLNGIVNKDGEVIPPAIWDAVNNFLFIDEYFLSSHDKPGRELLNELNSVMENPEYNRKISYKAKDFKERKKDLYCKIYKGNLYVKTRFSLFLNTMMDLDHSGINELKAFKSRCICIPMILARETLRSIAHGKRMYRYEEISPPKRDVVIDDVTYEAIENYTHTFCDDDEKYLRKLNDLCRVYAVLGKIDEEVFNLILSLP